MIPFETRQDVDLFVHLQMYMQIESQTLSGRDHASFRSSMEPLKDVVDGDLCEQFSKLDFQTQRAVSEELDRGPGEIIKKLEQIRNKVL